jgi:hypothetical protein
LPFLASFTFLPRGVKSLPHRAEEPNRSHTSTTPRCRDIRVWLRRGGGQAGEKWVRFFSGSLRHISIMLNVCTSRCICTHRDPTPTPSVRGPLSTALIVGDCGRRRYVCGLWAKSQFSTSSFFSLLRAEVVLNGHIAPRAYRGMSS